MMPLDRIVAIALAVMVMTAPASADELVRLLAAGSLRSALTEVTAAFEAATGVKVQPKYRPSGALKDEIAGRR